MIGSLTGLQDDTDKLHTESTNEARSDVTRLLHGREVPTITEAAVKLAGSICGVPGVSILADAVVTLIETCEGIPKQKQAHRVLVLLPAYTVFRQSVKQLQRQCMVLLDVLKAEESDGQPTSQRLEGRIIDATEWVVPRL